MGGEIITFWTGQCGVQLANACWELYTLEHCISPDGRLLEVAEEDDLSFEKFFKESTSGQFVPRSIFIDLEPTVIDEIRVGMYRKLFNPDTLINSSEDAANNFARGFYSCGKDVIKNVIQATRKMAEHSASVQAFMIHHSFGGGTGSGFTSMLIEYLTIEYAKRTKVEFGVFPSATLSVSVVEPYNTILALHTPMENADLAAFFENEAIFRICEKNLHSPEITYTLLNRIIAQVMSGTTASLRFEGPINANIIDFQTNLVPYPRIHFPLISFSPIIAQSRIDHANVSTQDITEEVFLSENQMSDVDPMDGAYMSCCLLYRGHINIIDANSTINHLKTTRSMPWVDWCPTGFKVGINYQPMLVVPAGGIGYSDRALSLLCNTTAIKSVIKRVNKKFLHLYSKKAFVHWYVAEGMEESEFIDAFEDVLMLEKDYEIIESTVSMNSDGTNDTDINVPALNGPASESYPGNSGLINANTESVSGRGSPDRQGTINQGALLPGEMLGNKSTAENGGAAQTGAIGSKTGTDSKYSQSRESRESGGTGVSPSTGGSSGESNSESDESNQNHATKILFKRFFNSSNKTFNQTSKNAKEFKMDIVDNSASSYIQPLFHHNNLFSNEDIHQNRISSERNIRSNKIIDKEKINGCTPSKLKVKPFSNNDNFKSSMNNFISVDVMLDI